ncbi:hypothetical protein O181_060168 [Austropuccinia psidii MF-1]|uniref:Uncharacterized protein n=1 Tax=Austropuccinia psidii MF-1 TaxID=1389203 RepID=A0A9Q3EK79_9BASI|nr:hypothetical protein [Austropuccinia psidii MF-1]
MIPPHFKDSVFPRDYSLQRESAIRRNRDLRGKEVEVDHTDRIWQNELYFTFQDGFQHKPSRRALHRIRTYSDPSNLQRNSPMENGRQLIQPRVPLERTSRKYLKNFPQRDILQRTHENPNRVKFQQEVQNSEKKGSQEYRESSYYLTYGEEVEPERAYCESFRLTSIGKPTKVPSGFITLRNQHISDQESPCFPIPVITQERDRIIGKVRYFFQPEEEIVRPSYPEIFGTGGIST